MQWKTIEIGRRSYRISDEGDVFSYSRACLIGGDGSGGYLYAAGFGIHRLVMWAFVGPQAKGVEVNHKNGIKTDNRLSNLEYVSREENIRHAHAIGLRPSKGQDNKRAKLTDEQVLEIRKLREEGKPQKELAEKFGVHKNTISDIVLGKKWPHLLAA